MVDTDDGILECDQCGRMMEIPKAEEKYEKALAASPFTQGDVDEMIASGFLKPEKKARLNTKSLEDIDNLQVWSTRLSAAVTSNEKRLTAFDDVVARLEKQVAVLVQNQSILDDRLDLQGQRLTGLAQDLEHERNQKIQWCGILGQFGARIYALENPVVEAKTKEKTTECLNDTKKSL